MGDFDASYTGGEYGLGSFWPTWIFCLILGLSSPVSYAPQIGDYTRRVSQAVNPGRLMVGLGLGLFVGLTIPIVFGAFTATAFIEATDSYMTDIVNASPAWYVVGILIVAVLGGLGQGVLCVYSTGLDLESFIPKLNRFSTTALAGAVSVALVFVAVYVFNAVDAVVASTLLINVLVVPWSAILLVFILRNAHHEYDVYDLQAFAQRRKGGIYWFRNGFFWVAVLAWAVGGAFGVMTVNADLYVGPWANMADGIDVSILGSAALSIVIYRGRLLDGEPALTSGNRRTGSGGCAGTVTACSCLGFGAPRSFRYRNNDAYHRPTYQGASRLTGLDCRERSPRPPARGRG